MFSSLYLGFSSEDLDRMTNVITHLHLRVEDDLVLTSKPLLYALSRSRVARVRPPNVLVFIHETRPVTVNGEQEFLAVPKNLVSAVANLTIKCTGPVVGYLVAYSQPIW